MIIFQKKAKTRDSPLFALEFLLSELNWSIILTLYVHFVMPLITLITLLESWNLAFYTIDISLAQCIRL
jgi:hypothetical protein